MWVTTNYIGIERGDMNYLFLLLTETYVEAQKRIAESLSPLLTEFARDLGEQGALVRPFPGDEGTTLGNALEKDWSNDQIMQMRDSLPALLIIDVDFNQFDPKHSNFFYVSLRDSMNKYGDVEIFQVRELLNMLVEACRCSNLFRIAREHITAQDSRTVWEALELKPEFMGFSFDLKKAIEFLRLQRQRRRQSHNVF